MNEPRDVIVFLGEGTNATHEYRGRYRFDETQAGSLMILRVPSDAENGGVRAYEGAVVAVYGTGAWWFARYDDTQVGG